VITYEKKKYPRKKLPEGLHPGNRQLAHIDFATIKAKSDVGLALNLRELSVRTGFGYTQVRRWILVGLPVFHGKVFWGDFVAWKAQRLGLNLASQAIQNRPTPPVVETIARPAKEISPARSSRGQGRHLEDIL
jgi:hypothetical protein